MPIASLVQQDAAHPPFIWRNGAVIPWESALVHVNAVGHASVSSVFEGVKAYWNAEREQLYVFRLREHMQRLLDSIRIARLGNRWSLDGMTRGVLEILRANAVRRDMYIRPWAFLEGTVYEQIAPADAPAELVIDTWPFTSAMLTERGCRVGVSSWTRIEDNAMPPRAKAFANYHNGRLAAIEAKINGHDWPLFLNERRKVAEGPGACLALVRSGAVITPNLTSGILESITRATLLEILPAQLGIPVIEREVDRSELYLADELFFMGTGWEVLPIRAIDGLAVGGGRMGPVTRAVDRAYHDLVRGIDPGHPDWRTPVWE